MKLLEGKYALITGGGRGIGRAVATEFAKNGANIAITALEEDELSETADQIKEHNVEVIYIPADLSKIDGIKFVVNSYFNNFNRCDILVNNAGMSYYSPMSEVDLTKAEKLFKINLIAYYMMTALILPKMIEQNTGNIIMTSSVHGNMFFNPNQVVYSSTKAGVTAMCKCLHKELKPYNIQVNAILPGPIKTKLLEDSAKRGQMTPDPIAPEMISPIYLFLASKLSHEGYEGKIVNQYLLFELLSLLKDEINNNSFDIKELTKKLKDKLKKNLYSLLRENQELVEFILKY